jgi:hypothetical protein
LRFKVGGAKKKLKLGRSWVKPQLTACCLLLPVLLQLEQAVMESMQAGAADADDSHTAHS